MRRQHVEVPIPDDLGIADLDRAFAARKETVKKARGVSDGVVLRKSRPGGPYRVTLLRLNGVQAVKDDHVMLRVTSSRKTLEVTPRDMSGRYYTYLYFLGAVVFIAGGSLCAATGGGVGFGLAMVGLGVLFGALGYGTRWATRGDEKDDVAKAAQLTFDRARELKNDSARG